MFCFTLLKHSTLHSSILIIFCSFILSSLPKPVVCRYFSCRVMFTKLSKLFVECFWAFPSASSTRRQIACILKLIYKFNVKSEYAIASPALDHSQANNILAVSKQCSKKNQNDMGLDDQCPPSTCEWSSFLV